MVHRPLLAPSSSVCSLLGNHSDLVYADINAQLSRPQNPPVASRLTGIKGQSLMWPKAFWKPSILLVPSASPSSHAVLVTLAISCFFNTLGMLPPQGPYMCGSLCLRSFSLVCPYAFPPSSCLHWDESDIFSGGVRVKCGCGPLVTSVKVSASQITTYTLSSWFFFLVFIIIFIVSFPT